MLWLQESMDAFILYYSFILLHTEDVNIFVCIAVAYSQGQLACEDDLHYII